MKVFILGVLLAAILPADVITDWNGIMRATVGGETPQSQSRLAAITHLAVFEAVNTITKDYKPYLGTLSAEPGASPEAAAVAAAYRVLRNYFSGNAPNLDMERARSLASIPEGASKRAGIAVGEAAAAAMIRLRRNDGSATTMAYTPQTGVGHWQPVPPANAAGTFLHWGKVTPFGMVRGDQFRSKPPPKFSTGKYRRDYNEVKAVGSVNSTERSQEALNLVRFVAMTSPTQLWNSAAVQVSTAQRTSLSDNARVFALLNMAIADAAIAVFDSKYFYHLWRPVTAIRNGDLDGNSKTDPDPSYLALIATPPYPAYPSGAGGLANAGRYVLERFFGSAGHSIMLSNPALPGVNLRYTRFRQITDDTADARIFGGIHFRFDQDAAELLGSRVGRHVYNNHLGCDQIEVCEDSDDEEVCEDSDDEEEDE